MSITRTKSDFILINEILNTPLLKSFGKVRNPQGSNFGAAQMLNFENLRNGSV